MKFTVKKWGRALAVASVVALTAAPVVVIADASNPMYAQPKKKKKSQVKPRKQVKARTYTKTKKQTKPVARRIPAQPANDFVPSYAPPTPMPQAGYTQPVYTPPQVANGPVLMPADGSATALAPRPRAGAQNYVIGLLGLAGLVAGGFIVADSINDDDTPTSP